MNKIDFFNQALARMGVRPLSSPDDTREEATLCQALFPAACDEVLDLGDFSCSLKRADLARDSVSPSFGFQFRYPLPADFLHLVELDKTENRYSIENGAILTDSSHCRIVYAARIDDVSRIPPTVANAIVVKLAAKLAGACANRPTMANSLEEEFLRYALPHARAVDGYQKWRDPGTPYWDQIN